LEYRLEYKIKKAVEFEKSGKILHAVQIYNSLIDENPGYIDSFIRLALLYEKTGHIESVKKTYKKGLKFNPNDTALSLSSGQFFIRNKLWGEAEKVLKNVSPEEEPLVSLLIAYAYFNMEEYEIAKMHLLKFIISDVQPELIHEACLFLAKIEYIFHRFEDALKYIHRAELLLNDFWELHFIKAKILYRQKMYSHSASEIKLAIKLNSEEPELHSWAGKIYIKCKDFEKAEDHLIKFIRSQDSVSTDTHLDLADVFQEQNRFSEAERYLNEVLKNDPENPEISRRKETLSKLINSIPASDE
jgi:tetratricopeptide (TPR) repeat protein